MVQPAVFEESTQLPGAVATQYASPPQVTSIIKKLTLVNTDSTAGYIVTIHLVPVGGAAGAANMLVDALPVGPLQTVDVTVAVNQILAGGGFIAAFANVAAKVNFRCSGVQIA